MPDLRQAQLDGYPPVQPDVQDLPGRYRKCEKRAVPPSGDGAGHFCQLPERATHNPQEDPVRCRSGGQVLP